MGFFLFSTSCGKLLLTVWILFLNLWKTLLFYVRMLAGHSQEKGDRYDRK